MNPLPFFYFPLDSPSRELAAELLLPLRRLAATQALPSAFGSAWTRRHESPLFPPPSDPLGRAATSLPLFSLPAESPPLHSRRLLLTLLSRRPIRPFSLHHELPRPSDSPQSATSRALHLLWHHPPQIRRHYSTSHPPTRWTRLGFGSAPPDPPQSCCLSFPSLASDQIRPRSNQTRLTLRIRPVSTQIRPDPDPTRFKPIRPEKKNIKKRERTSRPIYTPFSKKKKKLDLIEPPSFFLSKKTLNSNFSSQQKPICLPSSQKKT